MKFEISHFVLDDNQRVMYWGKAGWRRSRQPAFPTTKALKTMSLVPLGEISNI